MEFVFSLRKKQRVFVSFLSEMTNANLPNFKTNWHSGCSTILFCFSFFIFASGQPRL